MALDKGYQLKGKNSIKIKNKKKNLNLKKGYKN